MPSRRSGARAVSRASISVDDAAALLEAHPLSHSLHVVVPSFGSESGEEIDVDGGNDVDVSARRSTSLLDLLPRPPPYFCVPALDLADLTTPDFIEWAFPPPSNEHKIRGACGLAAPASLDGGAGASLSSDGRLAVALPAEELERSGAFSGPARRNNSGKSDWYTSEVFLTSGRGRREERRKGEKKNEEEMQREEGATTTTATTTIKERGPLLKARERLKASTGPVPFALLAPDCPFTSLATPPPPLPGACAVAPRERRRSRALAPHGPAPDFASFFKRTKAKGRPRDETEIDDGGRGGGGRGEDKEEEEENADGDETDDDDREKLREALEWLGLSASLSSPSVSVVSSSPFAEEEGGTGGKKASFVDVRSYEGLMPSSFAKSALEAAAEAVKSGNGAPPWAALVLVGFPDSPVSWMETRAKKEKKAKKATKKKEGARSSSPPPPPSSTPAAAAVAARLGPEACREHALFVVVMRGEEGESPPRFLVAVASGGGDGFERL